MLCTQNGKLTNIKESSLNLGDLVILQAGEVVPADLNLVEARGIEVDEFEITGEIMPVIKKADDQDGKLYMGSKIIRGNGKGLVVATGAQTEFGGVLKQEQVPIQPDKLQIFKKKYLLLIGLALPAFILYLARSNHDILIIVFYFLLSSAFLLLQNNDFFRAFLVSVELNTLRPLHIQIRDINALGRLSEIDIISFDKTGVLTTRQVEIAAIYLTDGIFHPDEDFKQKIPFHLITTACSLCHDVYYFEKLNQANPIDKALILFAQQNGLDVKETLIQNKRIYDEPFDSEKRYMACGFETVDGKVFYFVKGDPNKESLYRKPIPVEAISPIGHLWRASSPYFVANFLSTFYYGFFVLSKGHCV